MGKTTQILSFGGNLIAVETIHNSEGELRAAIQKALEKSCGKDTLPTAMNVSTLDEILCWENGFRILAGPQRAVEVDTLSERRFAVVRWMCGDAIEAASNAGVELSDEEAAYFWKKNSRWFRDDMIAHGNELLGDIDWGEVKEHFQIEEVNDK